MKTISGTLASQMGEAWLQVATEVGEQREQQKQESEAWQGRVEKSGETLAGRVDQAFDRVTNGLGEQRAQQQQQFDAWLVRIEKLGETLATRQEEVSGKLATQSSEHWQKSDAELVESRTRQEQQAEAVFGRLEELTRSLAEQNSKTLSTAEAGGQQLGHVAAALSEGLESLVEQAESLQTQVGSNVAETQRSMTAQFDGLQEGLSTLSRVLQDLGGTTSDCAASRAAETRLVFTVIQRRRNAQVTMLCRQYSPALWEGREERAGRETRQIGWNGVWRPTIPERL
jgi:hypothetical protein